MGGRRNKKICNICKVEKTIHDFGNNRNSKDGKHKICKICKEKQDIIKKQNKIFLRSNNTYLNEKFTNSHGHHITTKLVIYIPSELHNYINHNIWTGYNMEEINTLAWRFLLY